MDHLEAKKKSCLLHYGVNVFLREVYGDLRGTGHKAMFKPGDLNFKVAEAAEKKEKEKYVAFSFLTSLLSVFALIYLFFLFHFLPMKAL